MIQIFKIFLSLLSSNFIELRHTIMARVLNATAISIPIILVGEFILPIYGIRNDFGIILASSIIIGAMFFSNMLIITEFITKIESKQIDYYVLLPIPFWAYCLQFVLYHAFYGIIMAISTIPLIILILYTKNIFANLEIIKFISSILLIGLLNSSFAFFLACYARGMRDIENIILRIIVPLGMLGGYQFSWYTLFHYNKYLGYLSLLNPYTYTNEAIRSTIIKGEYISFPISMFVIAALSCTLLFTSVRKLKNKLDLI